MNEVIDEYELETINVNTLNIERTFLDKVMAVKRHAVCGNLENKVRHIYDVTRLIKREEIIKFLNKREELKALIQKTKQTDSFYLEKRNISKEYNPLGQYDFESWKQFFDDNIRKRYESLHEDLLYTNEKQFFDDALEAFRKINEIFSSIDE